jgi:uncharacterized membrane protein YqiK
METTLTMLGVVAGSIVMMFAGLVFAARSFYVVPRADQALVKTGGTSPVVSTGGGLWVIPLFHRVTPVSLRAVKIPIERTGENALPTANKIPAEIRGELIVRVSPDDPRHVVLAAQSLGTDLAGHGTHMETIIQQQVDSLVTDALRTAAFKKSFQELNLGKKEFADEVTQLLAEDLAKLGLTLAAVTIPHLKQGDFSREAGDVFAAEGQRNVAETVAKNRQETNQITQSAEVQILEQNVAARRRSLELERTQKELESEQARQVAEFTATKETETRMAVLTQEQARQVAEAEQKRQVETARIAQDQQIEAASIERELTIATQRARAAAEQKRAEEEGGRLQQEAEIARQKSVEAAMIEKDQTIKVADERRAQAVAEAQIVREVVIAQKKAEEAAARALQATAESEKERAEQGITTVEAEAKADRERKVVVIKAEEEATRQKVAADRDAYVQTRKAEADRDAAQKRAEGVRADATGAADALKLKAEADAAAKTVQAEAELVAAEKLARAKIALAEATLEEGRARAESTRLMVEAQNTVSNSMMVKEVAMAAVAAAPQLLHELMAPVAKVSDVKVVQINGLGGSSEGTGDIPSTILGAGLAAAGALPVVRDALRGLTQNAEVRELAGMVADAAGQTLRATVDAVRDTQGNGVDVG